MPSKKKETVELRGRDDVQLQADLEAAHQALFNLRFQSATGQLDDNSRLRILRKDVARINALLREREIAAAEAAEGEQS